MEAKVLSSLAFTIDPLAGGSHDVSAEEALSLLAAGAFVLDIRPPRAFAEDGHLPGAQLLPREALATAPAVLPEDGRPVLVVCEQGLRSRSAAAFLAEAGVGNVHVLSGGMARWRGPREKGPGVPLGPSEWLVSNALLAPRGARTLDVACGRGRHALLLAAAGSLVRAVDQDRARVDALDALARRLRLPIEARQADLQQPGCSLGQGQWELIMVFNFLHRPLFPALVAALAPGGVLLYETFTREHGQRHGRPSRSEHLLEPGELPRLVAPLEVVRRREGEFGGRYLASVAARKPTRALRTVPSSPAAATARVAPAPKTQSHPARRRTSGANGSGSRTPGARKR
ncbi:MAG TPA: rhodanese-like domain-containing protein [Vicinamibacteria bacterium]|nr:rhodanese-like domain-containing protein [Vicinamibacteria bacterium]